MGTLALRTAAWGQSAGSASPKPVPDGSASAELRQIVEDDQVVRQAGLPTTLDTIKKMIADDRMRRERVAALLRDGKLITGEDFDNAALVFQHGAAPDDFLTAHELAVIAVLKGRRTSLPALAEDRFLQSVGRTQRFGTQFKLGPDGKMQLSPVAEESPAAVTDALRADLFVPTPAEWRQYAGVKAYDAAMPGIELRWKRGRDPKWIAEAARRPEAAELERLSKSGTRVAGADTIPRALELYRSDRLAAPADYANAATILRRSKEPDALLLAHELAVVAAMRGDGEAGRLAAESLDAYLVAIGQPQRYGTATTGVRDGKPVPDVSPTVTDAVRAAFGVPPLAETIKTVTG